MKAKIATSLLLTTTLLALSPITSFAQTPDSTQSNPSAAIIEPKADEQLSFQVVLRYTNGLPVPAGTTVQLRNLSTDLNQVLTKTTDANGTVLFTQADGLQKNVSYSVESPLLTTGFTFSSTQDGLQTKEFTVALPVNQEPLSYQITLRYPDKTPVPAGTVVKLRNLSTDLNQVLTKTTDANGTVLFTQADGLQKNVSYSVESPLLTTGFTFNAIEGGLQTKEFTVDFPKVNQPTQQPTPTNNQKVTTNSPTVTPKTLPQTGEGQQPILSLLGIVSVLLALVGFKLKR